MLRVFGSNEGPCVGGIPDCRAEYRACHWCGHVICDSHGHTDGANVRCGELNLAHGDEPYWMWAPRDAGEQS